jgi:glycosyltransferase involved in cell wall biosynthesis
MAGPCVYIASLKFSPGLKKEFMLLGDLLAGRGARVRYLLSGAYERIEGGGDHRFVSSSATTPQVLLDALGGACLRRVRAAFGQSPPDLVLLYNPHPLNSAVAAMARQANTRAIRVLYLHDPYKADKRPYGLLRGGYFAAMEWMQGRSLAQMDHLILPSANAMATFAPPLGGYPGQVHEAALLVPDRFIDPPRPEVFSIVGHAHPATGHDTFVDFVNAAAGAPDTRLRFVMLSSSRLGRILSGLSPAAGALVDVINQPTIPDARVDAVIRRSYAVVRLDRELTQSGVLPLAFMHGVPVIARDILGLSQHVRHGVNGLLVDQRCTGADLLGAARQAMAQFEQLSGGARGTYERMFSPACFERYYGWLLAELGLGSAAGEGTFVAGSGAAVGAEAGSGADSLAGTSPQR